MLEICGVNAMRSVLRELDQSIAPCKLMYLSAYNVRQPRIFLSRASGQDILHPKPLGAPGVDLDDGPVLAPTGVFGRRQRLAGTL